MPAPWEQDKKAYRKLLGLLGYTGTNLEYRVTRMEIKEAHSLSLLGDIPVEPRLKDANDIQIDFAWIEGETCSPLFDKLTPSERYVLYVMYNEKDPAAFLGISYKSYRRMIKDIREKLANDSKGTE